MQMSRREENFQRFYGGCFKTISPSNKIASLAEIHKLPDSLLILVAQTGNHSPPIQVQCAAIG